MAKYITNSDDITINEVQQTDQINLDINRSNILSDTVGDSSTTKAYNCNYTNQLHTYSANETVIGIWIDGKPIYRKVINFTTSSSSVTNWANITNIQDIDTAIDIKGIYKISDRVIIYPRYESASYYLNFRIYNKYIQYMDMGYLNQDIKIIVEYTKTTD